MNNSAQPYVRNTLRGQAIGLALLLTTFGATAQESHTLVSPNNQLGGFFGFDVGDAGDVDGDGLNDLIVGAENEFSATGRAYVFSGATGLLIYELIPPTPESGGYFGTSVDGLGDVNGDGLSDLLIGSRSGSTPNGDIGGLALVFSGADGSHLYSVYSPNSESGSAFGAGLSRLGDVDGDSVLDFVVAASGENTTIGEDAGRSYVFSGADGELLHTLESPEAMFGGGLFGTSLSGIDDVDADGRPDILVGTLESSSEGARVGKVYLFSGASGDFLRSIESTNPQAGGHFGESVAGLPDVNGDGKPDVLIGAPFEALEGGNGRAYVVDGVTGLEIYDVSLPTPQPNSRFGSSVAVLEDGTFISSAPSAVEEGTGGIGLVIQYRSNDGAYLAAISSPNPQDGGGFGNAVASIPIPRSPILVGAFSEDAGPGVGSGRSYLMQGAIVVGVPQVPESVDIVLTTGPNPANGETTIRYHVADAGPVLLSVFDALGRAIAKWTSNHAAGRQEIRIDTKNLAPGVYLIRLESSGTVRTRLLTVVP